MALKEIGPYMSVNFSDKVIHLTIELMGGWPNFCAMETNDIKWKQIEFEKIYKGVCQNDNFPKHLPGIHDEENLKTRHIECSMPIVMVGEPIKKKLLDS